MALNHARSNAGDALATGRLALENDSRAVERDREAFLAEAAVLREQMSSANHKVQLAAAQTTELQRLTRRLEAQLEEVGHQRDVALAQAADGEVGRQALEARIQSLQDAAQAERARAEALEGQLGALRDLPAALEAAIRSSAGPVARKSRSRGKATARDALAQRQ